jgi:transcriptional regulator with XRE-family HTH domain
MPRLPSSDLEKVLDSTAKEIGSRIASLRKSKGFTQKELAEIIGVTRTVVTDYECGRVRLYDEILARLAVVLDCSTDYILGLHRPETITNAPQLKITRRMKELEGLPETKQKAILKTLDDLIRANS